MQQYSNNVTTLQGNAVPGASVLVKDAGGNVATIYSDNGVTPQTNPIITGRDGGYAFYAANGKYSATISASGLATEERAGIQLFDPFDGIDGGAP